MGFCGTAKWKRELVIEHKFDHVNVREFLKNTFGIKLKYFFMYLMVFRLFFIYVADLISIVFYFGRFQSMTGQSRATEVIQPYLGYVYLFCFLSSNLIFYIDVKKAQKIVRSRDISFAFTNTIAYRYYAFKDYAYFCFFNEISRMKSRKDNLALFVFRRLRGWKRLIFAEGFRNAINLMTVVELLTNNFSFTKFFSNPNRLYTAALMFIILSVAMFVLSLFGIFFAIFLYFPLICNIQGNLKEYICHKLEKRIGELIATYDFKRKMGGNILQNQKIAGKSRSDNLRSDKEPGQESQNNHEQSTNRGTDNSKYVDGQTQHQFRHPHVPVISYHSSSKPRPYVTAQHSTRSREEEISFDRKIITGNTRAFSRNDVESSTISGSKKPGTLSSKSTEAKMNDFGSSISSFSSEYCPPDQTKIGPENSSCSDHSNSSNNQSRYQQPSAGTFKYQHSKMDGEIQNKSRSARRREFVQKQHENFIGQTLPQDHISAPNTSMAASTTLPNVPERSHRSPEPFPRRKPDFEEEDQGRVCDDTEDECWEEIPLNNSPLEYNTAPAEDTISQEPLEITISRKANKRSLSTKRDTMLRTEIHKTHLLCLLCRSIWMNHVCDDEDTQARVLSVVPEKFCRLVSKPQDIERFLLCLKSLVGWWINDFLEAEGKRIDTKGRDSTLEGLVRALDGGKQYNSEQAVMGFIAMCRALRLETRLVVSLHARPYRAAHLKAHEKLSAVDTEDKEQSQISPEKTDGTKRKRSAAAKKPDPRVYLYSNYWSEIYCAPKRRWIPIDVLRCLVDQAESMEPPLNSSQAHQLSYVVALESTTDYIKDVTRRYSSRFQTRTLKYRLEDWWIDTLSKCCRDLPFDIEADRLETQELLRQSQKEALPNSIQSYHNHPSYVLERHLKKFEYIYPNTSDVVVGQVRGENIYLRSAIQILHTKEKWFSMEARVIRREELNQPVKIVKSRQQPTTKRQRIRNLSIEEEDDSEDENDDFAHILGTVDRSVIGVGNVGLYGCWQTEPYIPAPIVHGIIPKNKYNNIDLFLPSLLPPGAVHITENSLVAAVAEITSGQNVPATFKMPSLKKLMRELKEIDYAEAVVGFEYHGGRSVPTTDGIAVACEKESLVRRAYEEKTMEELGKILRQQEDRAIRNWKLLTKKWLTMKILEDKFN